MNVSFHQMDALSVPLLPGLFASFTLTEELDVIKGWCTQL